MQKVLIVGATSAIAEATARLFAVRGDRIMLAGRRMDRLEAIASDLRQRGADRVAVTHFDASQANDPKTMLDECTQALDGLDIALIAHGTLPVQVDCAASVELSLAEFQTNALSVIGLATDLGNRFEAQKHGCIAVISSVAGDRGRQSNYVYGAAKGAVSIFLQGLRNRLFRHGVQVLTIKPGFVDTPMTAEFSKGALWAKPEAIARGIVSAIDARRDVVYLPGFWHLIMLIIRHIPESIFKRLSL
jgi:short-subunit dehydrogenase